MPRAHEIGRQALERLRHLAVLADDPDAARPLADDDAAVRQEVKRERAIQAFGDRLDVVRGGLRRPRRARLPQPCGNRCIAVRRGAAIRRFGGPGACAGGRGITRGVCASITIAPSTRRERQPHQLANHLSSHFTLLPQLHRAE